MYQTKRKLSNIESAESETKKLRNLVDNRKTINCLENLPNEIFYEIFEYFECFKLFKSFSNLNTRFQLLLNNSSFPIRACHGIFHEDPEFSTAGIIISNKHRVLSLSLLNSQRCNEWLAVLQIDALFCQLQSIKLFVNESPGLIPPLLNLMSLPRLVSLSISFFCDEEDLTTIYQIVFNMPMLKYVNISYSESESSVSLPMATNEQISNIKYLVIDHTCTLDELITIISYTPQLQRLTCENVDESNETIQKDKIITIPTLLKISIKRCRVVFDDLETFLTKASPQLQYLRITTSNDASYLDANRWQRIISQNLRDLSVFEFVFQETMNEDFESTIYHEKINDFYSSFWFNKKWIFRVNLDTFFWNDHFIAYTIFTYKGKPSIQSNKESENNENFIPDNSSSTILSEINQFTVIDLGAFDYDEYFMDMFNPILSLIKITRLKIQLDDIFAGTLIFLIKCLPNLDSLAISSFSMLQPRSLSVEEFTTYRFVSNNNNITKVELQKTNDLAEVQFLLNLCPRMKYFDINSTGKIIHGKVIRFILMKLYKRSHNLSSISLQVSQTDLNITYRIKQIIDFEQLCQKYTLKQIRNRLYLKFSS